MRCPTCRETNPPHARFCSACGAGLVAACGECGTRPPPGAKFCPECGTRLSTDPANRPDDAERRPLTALFTDMIDSTGIASGLELEDFQELTSVYQRICAGAIERYDGHVAQYQGDGILAYFGYPKAQEDAAERAIRAGLAIRRAFERPVAGSEVERFGRIAVRVGIHTGTVLVGMMGSGKHRETLALGETMNIASRIQGVAGPNGVAVSEDTLRLVGGVFVTESLGAPDLRGVARQTTVHRVLRGGGARGRMPQPSGGASPMFGRDLEVGMLRDRWQRVLEGQGQSVLISGEPGIGKSRLTLALRDELIREPHLLLESGASPYRRDSALHPFLDLLERGLAFTRDEDAGARLERLDATLDRIGVDRRETLLAELLDLPTEADERSATMLALDADARRDRTIQALTDWVLALSEDQPVLLVVEDLHWADPTTLDLLQRLVDQVPGRRAMLVLSARPEFPGLGSQPKNWTPLALEPLRLLQVRELIESLRGDAAIPEEAIQQILDRGDGNPLYVEELLRAAIESLGRAVEVPATLHDSLMARLDRLGTAKEIAQLASVIGREFDYPVLRGATRLDEEILALALDALVAAKLLLQRGSPPDSAYMFRHALIREAAYGSLLRGRRRELHARVAALLEETTPELLGSEPEVLAYHYEEAGDLPRAVRLFTRAGERATARSATREAIRQLEHALELLGRLPEGPARDRDELGVLLALGPALNASRGAGDPETRSVYLRARELCGTGEPQYLHVLGALFTYDLNNGHLDEAAGIAEEQLRAAPEVDDRDALMRAHWSLGQVLFSRGRISASVPELERAVELCDPDRDHTREYDRVEFSVSLRSWRSWALWLAGRGDAALASSDDALEHARASGHAYSLAYGLGFAMVLHVMRHDWHRARQRANEVIQVASEGGFPFYRGIGELSHAWANAVDPDEEAPSKAVVDQFRQVLGSITERGSQIATPLASSGLAEIFLTRSEPTEALEVTDLALAFAQRTGLHYWNADLVRQRGEILEVLGGADASESARAHFVEAGELAREQGALGLELRAGLRLAELERRVGADWQAREQLRTLHDAFEEGHGAGDLLAASRLLEAAPS